MCLKILYLILRHCRRSKFAAKPLSTPIRVNWEQYYPWAFLTASECVREPSAECVYTVAQHLCESIVLRKRAAPHQIARTASHLENGPYVSSSIKADFSVCSFRFINE